MKLLFLSINWFLGAASENTNSLFGHKAVLSFIKTVNKGVWEVFIGVISGLTPKIWLLPGSAGSPAHTGPDICFSLLCAESCVQTFIYSRSVFSTPHTPIEGAMFWHTITPPIPRHIQEYNEKKCLFVLPSTWSLDRRASCPNKSLICP